MSLKKYQYPSIDHNKIDYHIEFKQTNKQTNITIPNEKLCQLKFKLNFRVDTVFTK